MQYSKKILNHFSNPRNTGEIFDADGIGTIGSEECGDIIKIWIKVSEDQHLADIKYRVFGCPAAIASCSMMTELAMGIHLDDAYELTDKQVADALGGLPDQKYHCSNLAASALHEAIMNYALKGSTKTKTITVTALIENTATGNLLSEHGLSLWLEFGDKRILLDAGQSDMIFQNAKLLGINLETTDAIVLSHGHYDHTGGLKAVLDIASNTTIYLHPEAFKSKYSQKDKKTRMIGMPDSAKEAIHVMANNGKVIWTEMPTELFQGLFVTGRIPRNTDFEDSGGNFFVNQNCQKKDELLDDQAIFFQTKYGFVILLGCAHAGVVNTLDYVVKLTNQRKIFAIIGGMHLLNASDERIEYTIDAFKKYDIQKIIPLHCTGQKATGKIKKAFGKKYMSCQAGEKIVFNEALIFNKKT